MSSRNLIVLLIENGCSEHVLDNELCAALKEYTKAATDTEIETADLYAKSMVVVTRNDIELKQRDEHFEIKTCLEDYHIDSLNDYIEDKLDDDIKNDEKPVYVLLHQLCDHIDDIKKLREKNFEIRSFVYICDKAHEKEIKNETEEQNKDTEKQTEEQNKTDKDENTENQDKPVDEEKEISISEKITDHFLNKANYESHGCLDNILLHKIDSWKDNDTRYKDITAICQEIRSYIHRIENEWNVYDGNWRNEEIINTENKAQNTEQTDEDQDDVQYKIPILKIPERKLKDVEEYEIYNKYMNHIKTPNISSIIQCMVAEIAQDEGINDDEEDTRSEDEKSGVYRYGDIVSQNNYLNKTPEQQMEADKTILNQCCQYFVESLFDENANVDQNTFETQTTARYTFSKLTPSIFDDALIYNAFNQLLSSSINDRIFREDLSKIQFIQRIQHLLSNQSIKCNKNYIQWLDAVILTFCIDVPAISRSKQENISVYLSSNIGFRKWLTLPQCLKNIKPNCFYSSIPSSFLYNNTISIYPPFFNHWFMGLSSFDSEPNNISNKPHLWLRDDESSVISISDHLSVHFPDHAQLTYHCKQLPMANIPPNTATVDENVDENAEEKQEAPIAPQNNTEDIIYISLPNEIIVEYHTKTAQLILYYQSALKQYQTQQRNKASPSDITESDEPSTSDANEAKPSNDTDKNEVNPDDTTTNETEEPKELEPVDVSWNNDKDIFIVWRIMDANGVITMFYSDDSERKVFPNSEIWYKSSPNNPWIIVKSNGECLEGQQTKKPINIATTTDSDTNTKIVTREDTVLVFCHSNGDGFVQCPDSTHIFVKSNITQNEWELHELSRWMQNMGVEEQSSYEISNLSQNTIHQSADKLKNDLTQIRFELKNDCKMPTVIVDKINKVTKVLFYNGFDATFAHPDGSENAASTINHIETGEISIYNKENIHFIPRNKDKSSEIYNINLNNENPYISIKEYKIALNGEYNAPGNSDNKIDNNGRLFVVFRDGNGYELLSNDTVTEFRQHLQTYEPKTQIFEPKPLLSTANDSPISHRFIIERFATNAPRTMINIPSVLRETLTTKVSKYKDGESHRSCHIYRHLLETSAMTQQHIETANHDLQNFEEWMKSDENKEKVKSNSELNKMNDQMVERRNKLKTEMDLSPLELKLSCTAEIEREKLNVLNEELRGDKESEDMQNTPEIDQEIKNKENEAQAREIRNIQQKNQEKLSETDRENVSYFENEPFLRDYEINQHLLEIFSYFKKLWTAPNYNYNNYNEQIEASFVCVLSSLKIVCNRLREIISVKTLDANLKMLSLDEEIMVNIRKNEYISNHIHDLLCCVGFAVSSKCENVYVPEQSNISIGAAICNIVSKLDEYHSKFKRFLFKMNNNNTDCVRTFEMDLKTKIISNINGDRSTECQPIRNYNDVHGHDIMDRDYYDEREHNNPELSRCVSRCGCCPLDSPQRATKMDVLGRSRKQIITMDDLENYPAAVSNEQLNTKYINTEGTVQTRVRTSSTFNQALTSYDAFPTIMIQPNVFDFGTVSMGYIYRFTASVTNHGNTQARFKMDIPQQNDDCRSVHIKPYYRSGGIAPGITIMLEIEFHSKDFIGEYLNQITIKTQKHIFNVNIKANVVEHHQNFNHHPINGNSGNKKSRVRCLGKKY